MEDEFQSDVLEASLLYKKRPVRATIAHYNWTVVQYTDDTLVCRVTDQLSHERYQIEY